MPELQFSDEATLSGTRITADGYLVADVRCARTGIQQYRASDVGLPGDGMVNVYRPEAVVFDKASLATFAGKPVTINHPAEPVTAENWRALAVGDIGTEIARDGEYVRVPMKLMDAAAIKLVEAGTRQISMGYTTGLSIEDGVAPDGTPYQAVQTGPIRINHLAIVAAARGGSNLRIGDGADHWGASPLTKKDADMPEGIKTRVVLIDGLSVETTDAGAQALEKLMNDAKATKTAHDAAIAAKDTALAKKDAELAAKDAQIDSLKAKVLDGAALDALVADRSALIAKAKSIAPAVVTDGKSAEDIRKAAVVAVKGAAMADKSEAYICAAFDLLADAVTTDPAAKALADMAGKKPQGADDLYSARSKSLSDAWKTPGKNKEVV